MVALKFTISSSDFAARARDRLRGNAIASATKVTWQRADGQRVLLDLASVKMRLLDGWLLCELDAQTDQTGRATLQFVFFLGRPKEADGMQAAATINAATAGATQIAAVWGADLQRVLWDVVLDVLEACVWQASSQQPGQPIAVQGYHATADTFNAEVLAGAFPVSRPPIILNPDTQKLVSKLSNKTSEDKKSHDKDSGKKSEAVSRKSTAKSGKTLALKSDIERASNKVSAAPAAEKTAKAPVAKTASQKPGVKK